MSYERGAVARPAAGIQNAASPRLVHSGRKLAMPMAAAGNQIPLGDKLYFFTSPTPATTKCLIWAHGGLLRGDGTYALPAGTTIHYYVPHGQARVTNPTRAIRAG